MEDKDDEDILNLEGILDIKEFLCKPEKNKPNTKKEFILFVHELSKDYYDDSESWENIDIGSYLEALAGWVSDMEGVYKNRGLPVPENPHWQVIADMLGASKEIDVNGIQNKREIKTKQNFVFFANELSESFYDDPGSWKSKDIGTYLEAIAAWINEMEDYYKKQGMPVPENLDWQLMSRMLSAARYYE